VIKLIQQTKQTKKESMSESLKSGSEATESPVAALSSDAAVRLAKASGPKVAHV
jgi:hypothetical protein